LKMFPKIDLRTHTAASGGILPQEREIVKLASKLKVEYLGITDHDTFIARENSGVELVMVNVPIECVRALKGSRNRV